MGKIVLKQQAGEIQNNLLGGGYNFESDILSTNLGRFFFVFFVVPLGSEILWLVLLRQCLICRKEFTMQAACQPLAGGIKLIGCHTFPPRVLHFLLPNLKAYKWQYSLHSFEWLINSGHTLHLLKANAEHWDNQVCRQDREDQLSKQESLRLAIPCRDSICLMPNVFVERSRDLRQPP